MPIVEHFKNCISREMTIDEIFAKFPQKAQKLAHVLSKAGLQCVGCSASTWETLESGAARHGMVDEQLVKLLKDLHAILEETTDGSTISLTPKAAERFKAIAAAEGKTGYGIRFDEEPAGCSGFEYVLDFSETAREDDAVFLSHGIEIHVRKKSASRLLGAEIDFVDGLDPGFKIINPNVRHSCGCGSSHGYTS